MRRRLLESKRDTNRKIKIDTYRDEQVDSKGRKTKSLEEQSITPFIFMNDRIERKNMR